MQYGAEASPLRLSLSRPACNTANHNNDKQADYAVQSQSAQRQHKQLENTLRERLRYFGNGCAWASRARAPWGSGEARLRNGPRQALGNN